MSVAASRSHAPSHTHTTHSHAAPAGSVVSSRSHRSSGSHHSGSAGERPPTSVPAASIISFKAPTVVPSDSISQIGEQRSTAPSHAGHASHHSHVSAAHSHAVSQRLTEANLEAHNTEPQSSAGPTEPDADAAEEHASKASHRSGGTAKQSRHTIYRVPTVEDGSVAGSHRTPTVVPSKAGMASGSKARSTASSRSGSASPSRARSTADSQARSRAPTSAPAEEIPPVPSKAPTVAPSHAGSVAPSQVAFKAPTSPGSQAPCKAPTSASSTRSATPPTSPTSPTAPTSVAPTSPPSAAKSVVSQHNQLPRSVSDTDLSTSHAVEVERTDEQVASDTGYRILRRHVYPVKPPLRSRHSDVMMVPVGG